jgi:hypothetical protein
LHKVVHIVIEHESPDEQSKANAVATVLLSQGREMTARHPTRVDLGE